MARQLQIPKSHEHERAAAAQRSAGVHSALARLANDLDQAETMIASLERALEAALDRAEAAEAKLEAKKPKSAKSRAAAK